MELINNNVFLLLALSSLFSSAIAICVPRNSSNIAVTPTAAVLVSTPTVPPQIAPQSVSPPQSSSTQQALPPQFTSAPTDSAPAEEESGSEEDSGLAEFHKLHSDVVSSVASSVTTNLEEICDVTSNPQLCETSISSQIHGTTVDPASALKTEIDQSIKEVTKAITTLNSLRKDPAASNAEIACDDTCLENFDMAIEDLKAGVESIDVHDIGRMESVLTAVMTDLMTCDDTFAEMGVDSPLDNLSTRMNKYASNCLALSKLLL